MKDCSVVLCASLAALVLASSAFAAPHRRKCPPTCHHRRHPTPATAPCPPCPPPAVVQAPAPPSSSGGGGYDLEVVGGFRWDRETECPAPVSCGPVAPPTHHQTDPAFLGVQLRVPVARQWTLQGRLDRDVIDHGELVQAAHWNGAVSLHWAPFRH